MALVRLQQQENYLQAVTFSVSSRETADLPWNRM